MKRASDHIAPAPITRRRRLLLTGSLASAAMPLGFAGIRAAETGGTDLRYLWMAAAAFLAAALATIPRGSSAKPSDLSVGRALGALLAAAAGTAAAGSLLGARSAAGIVIMSAAFGFFAGASVVLATLFVRSSIGPDAGHA